jgi:hypothetical protein
MSENMASFSKAIGIIKAAAQKATPEELTSMNEIMGSLARRLSEITVTDLVEFVRQIFSDEDVEVENDGQICITITKEHPTNSKKDKYAHINIAVDGTYLVIGDNLGEWSERLDIADPDVGRSQIRKWFYDVANKHWKKRDAP